MEQRRLPKEAFDSEYMTEFLREVRFLADKGIRYSFVRKTEDYGISQFKYKKTPALFAALVEFYSIIEAEKTVRKAKKESIVSLDQIRKAQEILEKAVQQNVIKTGIDVTDLQTQEINAIEKDDTDAD